MAKEDKKSPHQDKSGDRRVFLTTGIMGCSLAASYGTLAFFAGEYLYLAAPGDGSKAWRYVAKQNHQRFMWYGTGSFVSSNS